jgi:hypothetical protein
MYLLDRERLQRPCALLQKMQGCVLQQQNKWTPEVQQPPCHDVLMWWASCCGLAAK